MRIEHEPIWVPTSLQTEQSHVSALAAGLGVSDFDDLYQLSIERPGEYWAHVMTALGIEWSRPYERYVDLTDGPPFPKWFPGGELNWVDSALAWAKDSVTRSNEAVIAETEDGVVSTVTYGELLDRVERFAAGLSRLGLGRGDRIGLLMESSIEAVVSFLGIAALGAIVVPLFTGFGVDAIGTRLSACSARALVTTAGFRRRGNWVDTEAVVLSAVDGLPELEHLIVKRTEGAHGGGRRLIDWNEVDARPNNGLPARMGADDPFMIAYTSGTTGAPKGTVHTHGGFPLKIAHDAAVHFDIGRGDVWLWLADMGWVAGPIFAIGGLIRGATLVCYDGAPDFPDWSRMARLVERHRATHFAAAPTLIRGLAAHSVASTSADLSLLRLLITAGEVIDPEHFVWYQRGFGRGECPVINYTGGTEVSGALLANVMVRPIVPSGFNAVSPGVQVDVLDESGHPVLDQVGELAVLQPFVGMTKALWNDHDRYLETYWNRLPEVWVHGDLAVHRSDDGSFFLMGRSDDTMKIAGKRVGSAEIEEVLLGLSVVGEAAAIGVKDPVKGEKLIVFVVASRGDVGDHTTLPEEVSRVIERRLGKPFRPARVHVVAELPKTPSGKVMRRVIRNVYCGEQPGDLSALDNPEATDGIRSAAQSDQQLGG